MKKRYILIDILGPCANNHGLGNQMFQIAAGISYAKDYGFEARFPCLHQKKYGGYTANILRKLNIDNLNFESYQSPPTVTEAMESSFSYSPLPKTEDPILLVNNSYLQSEKYFSHNRELILDVFEPAAEDLVYLKRKYNLTKSTTSMHIRRKDYLQYSAYHTNLMETGYYDKALETLDPEAVIVFSDDPDWVREEFPDYTVAEEADYLELYLMSLCDNNIIANSSFSWWGAWLNKNPRKKVVAPKNWFGERHAHDTKDLIPSDWILL